MRPSPWLQVERHRLPAPYGGEFGWDCGAFQIPHPPTGVTLRVIASSDDGWEHVSVSLPGRTPNWREMEFVCRLFWAEDECVMQLHPPRAQWISNHPHCLHLWRPADGAIPQPPSWMVGDAGLGQLDPASPKDRRLAERAKALLLAKEGKAQR